MMDLGKPGLTKNSKDIGRRHSRKKALHLQKHAEQQPYIWVGTKGKWREESRWSYTVKTLLLPEWQFELEVVAFWVHK